MSAVANPDRLLSREEAAEYLNLKVQTLAHWASTGRVVLPYIRVGKLAKYRRSDLERFIEQNTIGALPGDES